MSHLTVRQKDLSKIRIQESVILELLQSMKIRVLKSELEQESKGQIGFAINDLESIIRDLFTLEEIKIKKIK